jgi:ATP-dependent DNA helicase RecG
MEEILENLLKLTTETEIVEFKEANTRYDKDRLGRYFSALANEANLKGISHAWFVMGVKDDKTIVGTGSETKRLMNIS